MTTGAGATLAIRDVSKTDPTKRYLLHANHVFLGCSMRHVV